jgi:Ran GTPase-activating protein (RanGAP) involved in mRNA processing and transport
VLSLKDNNLRSPGAKALADAIRDNTVLTDLDLASNHLAWHGTDGRGDDMSGVTALASATKDNGALSVLLLKRNNLGTKVAGKVLGKMLKENSVLKALDLSDNYAGDGAGFAQELAVGIKDNGALTKLDISGNRIPSEQEGGLQRICTAATIKLAL